MWLADPTILEEGTDGTALCLAALKGQQKNGTSANTSSCVTQQTWSASLVRVHTHAVISVECKQAHMQWAMSKLCSVWI